MKRTRKAIALLLSILLTRELKRIKPDYIEKYLPKK